MTHLIIGNGYLGNKIRKHFNGIMYPNKVNDFKELLTYLDIYHPKFVINCAGKTGNPNVDWCESHKEETFFSNVIVPTFIWQACKAADCKMVHMGSGCIYYGDNGGKGFSEEDEPNFDASYYSWTKKVAEKYLKDHDVLQIRIRMPLSDEESPRNLLTKLLSYNKILRAKNSITYLPDMLNVLEKLLDKNASGIFNVVNYEAITHPEILDIYAELSGNQKAYEVIDDKGLDKLTAARRSNCILSTDKLKSHGVYMMPVKEAVKRCVLNYAFN